MGLTVPDFSGVQVLVLGDLMLDQYCVGPVNRISPEAPVPVVRIEDQRERPGGAANVACNLASLGVQTRLLGLLGDDAAGARLSRLLSEEGVTLEAPHLSNRPTSTKLRVLSRNQQLLRLDTETPFSAEEAAPLQSLLASGLAGASVCVLSDYAKGALADAPALIAQCRQAGVPVLVDPKGRDFERYRGASLLTPNRAEFEAVAGAAEDEQALLERAVRLRDDLELEALVVTLGERGMAVVPANGEPAVLTAQQREVFDVTGAGDTVIATLAAGLGAGLELRAAATLANLAGGLAVQRLGAATISAAELRLGLHAQGRGGRGVIDRATVLASVAASRQRGESIVMTNGCFDLLHPGHVAYLEEAKTLGDRLIVAVNDDASVTRLKGEGRPVVALEHRMAVLAGLAAVDWVVPFSEDTPEGLIRDLMPDVLVKGGDYKPEEIAGAGPVLEAGGRVEVLAFREGLSTTAMLDKLRGG